MSLWATGRCVRAHQRARLIGIPHFDDILGRRKRPLTTTPLLQISPVKGANRPAGKARRKKDRANIKAAHQRTDWDDEDFSALEESVGGPSVEEEGDGPRITKIEMKKPRLPYSQFTTPREGEEADGGNQLPIPPFMRVRKKSTRFDKWYKTGTYSFDQYETQRVKESKAPFATAFAQNPWAKMLGTPLRHDSYSGARLPKACLLDFHLADDTANDRTKLLPLGLAAALVPGKRKLTVHERNILDTDRKERAVKPEGGASYVIAKKEAMDYISEVPKQRTRKRVLGMRMQRMLERDGNAGKLDWREDMTEVVLKAMRKIVRKRLRGFMQLKEIANNEGVIAALPNRHGLQALDDVENVGCVIRLKLLEQDESPTPTRIPEPKKPERSHFYPNTTSFLGDTYGEWGAETPAQRWAREDAARVERGDAPDTTDLQSSTTRNAVLDHWSREDLRGLPFLGHCLPLPPPCVPLTWYFPNIRYRGQRVPIYNIPYLLGDEEMEMLLNGTVFGDVNMATVTQPWTSAQLQIWLFKLQMYMARPKDETERV